MKIADVTISYPYVQYKVRVTHFTARRSTAVEWLILEAISRASALEAYRDISVADLMEQVFMISDADQLILPCLLSLQDMGAVVALGVDNDSKLATVPMRSLSMTPKGEEMQRDGLLPGMPNDSIISIGYKPMEGTLSENAEVRLTDSPGGIAAMHIESAADIAFPAALITEMIFRKRGEKSRQSRYSWLMPTTRIDSVDNEEAVLRWRNVSRKFIMTGNGNCSLEGVDDSRLDQLVLAGIKLNNASAEYDIPKVEFDDPDKELKEIFDPALIKEKVSEKLDRADVFIADRSCFSGAGSEGKNRRLRIAIVSNADEFGAEMRKHTLTVFVPENVFGSAMLYSDNSGSVGVGRFTLNADGMQREAVFGYSTAETVCDIDDICVKTALKYAQEDPRLLFMLYETGNTDLFLDAVRQTARRNKDISERTQALNNINRFSQIVYNKNCLTQDFMEEVMIDEEDIKGRCGGIDSAIEMVEEYREVGSDELYKAFLSCALSYIPVQQSVSEIWRLWDAVRSVKPAYINWIAQNGLYLRLYSEQIVSGLLNDFENDDIAAWEQMPVERAILKFSDIFSDICALMPEIRSDPDMSNETLRETLLGKREAIREIYEEIRKWREAVEQFEDRVCPINSVVTNGSDFSKAMTVMERLSEAASFLFGDAALKYSKVYIADTSALLNAPELISVLEDGSALLIVPQAVLNELDGLKESNDDEQAYNARAAIRAISNHTAFSWFNVKGSGRPELLPPDLGDPLQPDNMILSVAAGYLHKAAVLLSDDINLCNKAASLGLSSMSSQEFCESMERKPSKHKPSEKKNRKNKGNL